MCGMAGMSSRRECRVPLEASCAFDVTWWCERVTSVSHQTLFTRGVNESRPTWVGVLQCVAVCCRVLQCVAVCCSVLQCVAVCCSVLQCVAVCRSVLQRTSTSRECAANWCSVVQQVAACCSVMQCLVETRHCNVPQHATTRSGIATNYNTLQHD